MFTGIITDIGTINSAEKRGDLRLVIASGYDMDSVAIGASIACSGVCLTVVEKAEGWFAVDASAETVSCTASGMWHEGTRLNLERAVKVGDELGGHIVTGHVDGVGRIVSNEQIGDSWKVTVSAPAALASYIAAKGSITVDGVSLTVNAVDGAEFSVLLIPHTLGATTFGQRRSGDTLHIEVDLMARYAARLAEAQALR